MALVCRPRSSAEQSGLCSHEGLHVFFSSSSWKGNSFYFRYVRCLSFGEGERELRITRRQNVGGCERPLAALHLWYQIICYHPSKRNFVALEYLPLQALRLACIQQHLDRTIQIMLGIRRRFFAGDGAVSIMSVVIPV